MTKRILSILLALSLVLGTVPVAFAVDEAATEIETEIAMPEESAEAQKSTESYDDTEAVITESDNEEDTEISLMETGDQNETTGEDEGENEVEPEPELISIAEAREAEDGANVKIEGILTYEIDSYVFIQDGTAALAIDSSLLSAFKSGDTYTIEGTLATVEGIRTIIPETATLGLRGQELPVTQYVTIGNLNDGSNQGELIRIENVYLEKVTEDGNLYLMDKNTGEHIYVYQPAALNEMIWEDSYIDVTAIAYIQDGAPALRTTVENDIVFTRVPVEVYTEEDLNAMRNNMHYNYKLMADIEMTENWVCIGNNSKMFNGTFNGNGHTISNFNVVLDQEYQFIYAGLFGAIGQNGGVKNLTIEMTPGTGGVRAYDQVTNSYAGTITGFNKGTIENCHVTGVVHGNYYVGGIAGWNDGTIKNCSFNGSLEGTQYIGGVTGGSNSTGTVENCTTDVAFSGGSYAGGIAGQNNGTINECTATVSGSAGGYFGGIAGYGNGTIKESESNGSINCSGSSVGGIQGCGLPSISDCRSYLDITAGGDFAFGGGILGYHDSKSTVIIKNCESHGDITGFYKTGGILGNSNSSATIDNCVVYGNVIGGQYTGGIVGYIDYSSGRLNMISCRVVGVGVSGNEYTGGAVGYARYATINNCHVEGGAISSAYENTSGFISYAYGLTMENCTVSADVNAGATCPPRSSSGCQNYDSCGGIAGYVWNGTISNCHYVGNISTRDSYATGGIVGYSQSIDVEGCTVSADIISALREEVGGIVGVGSSDISDCKFKGSLFGGYVGGIEADGNADIYNCYANVNINAGIYGGGLQGSATGTIRKSFAEGTVSVSGSSSYAGGVAGYLSGTAYDNYANVDVKGNGYTGGFVGYIASGKTVERNYSIGSVTASDPSICGGFAGYNAGTNNVLRNYYDMEKSGQSDDTKGIPKTTAQMLRAASYVDWDFDTVWKISPDENNGYPQLRDTTGFNGDVVEETVYYISNEAELIDALNKKDGIFEITADIELTKPWVSVDNFYGIINGNNHTISNMHTTRLGFIGNMYGGEINNLHIKGSVISAIDAGGIVGVASYGAKISGCSFEGEVRSTSTSSSYRVGGIAAYCNGTINNCMFSGTVEGYNYVGGIVGYGSGTISECGVNGAVYGRYSSTTQSYEYIGGIAGSMSGTIDSSFARVVFLNKVGYTICGSGTISNCYSITANRDYDSTGTNLYQTYYYLSDEIKRKIFESICDDEMVWAIDPEINDGYPYLRNTPLIEKEEESPIEINTVEDFMQLNGSDKNYILKNDITIEDGQTVSNFYGTLDGDGHTICVNGTASMFSKLFDATVKNLAVHKSGMSTSTNGVIAITAIGTTIENCSVMGVESENGIYSAPVVGNTYSCLFRNVVAEGDVYYSDVDVTAGGFIQSIYDGTVVEDCGFNGNVTVRSNRYNCGGFAGYISNSTIRNSYSAGSVTLITYNSYAVGGFVGSCASGGIISGCYSHSDVYGTLDTGGFVGVNGGTIENSYATGAVVQGSSDSYYYAGGFCGKNNGTIRNSYSTGTCSSNYGFVEKGSVSNCYFDKTTSKCSYGGTGRTTEQMKDMSSYVDWDFDTVWAIDSGINDGYPHLRSTLPIPERVELTAQKETLFVGDTLQLEYSIYPENAPQLVSFASTDESVVTVSAGGFVTAIREGVATVSVRAGNQFDYVTFTVLTGQDSSTVISVDPIAQIELDYGATLDDAKGVLPTTVTSLLSNGSKVILPVEWTLIDGSQYDFEGTLVIGSGSPISNPAEVKAQCSVKVLDQPSEIASVEAISVSVPYATPLANVTELLPETVAVTLKNGKTYNLFVVWDNDSTPYYRSTTPGTYVFGGQLVLPENGIILNSSSKKASVSVLVLEEPETEREITAVVGNENINVAYGTTLTAVKSMLPAQVNVVFDGVETLPVDVVWTNDSSPSYQPKVPGVYTFTGTIVTNGNGLITNPHNLFATISFVVAESETGEKNMYVSSESAAIGSTVDVEISVDSNSTMTSGSFVVDFDSTSLSPVSYVVGEAIDTASVMVNANYVDPSDGKRKIKVSYVAFDEMNKGGNMITFKFMVNNTVADGKTLPITLKDVCAYDISENPIAFSVYGGSVAASLVIYGDTNGDGLVNILDAFRVVRYDAGYLTFDEKQSISADVDKNHIIDIFDAMKIQRFDIGLSSVLGE